LAEYSLHTNLTLVRTWSRPRPRPRSWPRPRSRPWTWSWSWSWPSPWIPSATTERRV